MAYMNSEMKTQIAAKIKPILAKYGVKGSLSVRNHSTIVLTLKSGKIDFVGNLNKVCSSPDNPRSHEFRPVTNGNIDVNQYWYQNHFDGVAKKFLDEVIPAMKGADWYDRSDIMTDYFDTAYYFDVNVGKWNKPYIVETV